MEPYSRIHPPLLGVSIDGPDPLGASDIRLDNGLTILYGVNGIGKSRVLRALNLALSGRWQSDDSWIHLQFESSSLDANSGDDLDEPIALAMKRALALTIATEGRDDYWALGKDLATESIRSMAEVVLSNVVSDDPNFIVEVLDQNFFSLRAVGRETPKWEVWISFLPSDDTPRIQLACDAFQRMSKLTSALKDRRLGGDEDIDSMISEIQSLLKEFECEAEGRGFTFPDLDDCLRRARFGSRAPWAPIPLTLIGHIEPETGIAMSFDDELLRRLTEESLDLLRTCRPIIDVASGDEVEATREAKELLHQMSLGADHYLEHVLGDDAPVVQCSLAPWGITPPLQWMATDRFSSSEIKIDSLGSGRSRWAMIAAYLAVADLSTRLGTDGLDLSYSRSDRVVIIDEPELGLHPTSVSSMFHGLREWARERSVVVATHSPVAFGDPSVALVHVTRDDGGKIVCQPMAQELQGLLQTGTSGSSSRTMQALGLHPGDILQTIRRFVIVEGAHDKAVLESVFGKDELARSRIQILTMRGTRNLMSVLGAQLIFDFTAADVLIVLDNTNGLHFESVWNAACQRLDRDGLESAHRELRSLDSGTAEEEKLREFCERALNTGQTRRIRVFGLGEPDIINYLPASDFVPEAKSWEELVGEWDRRDRFKEYLRKRGANVSAKRLGKLAGNLDVLHEDLVLLRSRLFSET